MKEKNIIQKTIIDLQFNASADGFALQSQTDDWCRGKLLPVIEEILEYTDTGGMFVTIDKLEITVNAQSKNWLHQLEKQIGEQLSKKLSDVLQLTKPFAKKVEAQVAAIALTRGENFFQVLIHFLQKGYLPWWSGISTKEEFSKELSLWLETPASAEVVERIHYFLQDKIVQDRVSYQLSNEEFTAFIIQLYPEIRNELEVLMTDVFFITQRLHAYQKIAEIQFRKWLLSQGMETATQNFIQKTAEEITFIMADYPGIFADNPKISAAVKSDVLANELKKLEADAATATNKYKDKSAREREKEQKQNEKQEPSKQNVKRQLSTDDAEEGIYINNAGLVIIAPFLPFFFKKLGLTEDDKLVDTDFAVNLVNYIASGNEDCAEFELCLPKILCGVEIETPVKTDFRFSQQQKDEVNDLLLSVIEYWEILKDTSPEGLREGFLQRDGKLFFKNDEWHLVVEQKGYDMLLGSLSWNISMVKLTWMQQLLRTEWAF